MTARGRAHVAGVSGFRVAYADGRAIERALLLPALRYARDSHCPFTRRTERCVSICVLVCPAELTLTAKRPGAPAGLRW